MIHTFAKNAFIAKFFYKGGQLIVKYQFRIPEYLRLLPEVHFYLLLMQLYLADKFLFGKKKAQGVIIGLRKELNAAGLRQLYKALQHIRPVFFKLLYGRAADG